MAAFASFHIGEKLRMLNWNDHGIKTFSETCNKKNRNIEDDFQIIRIINNKIFLEIGTALLRFRQLSYDTFRNELVSMQKSELILHAFDKLNDARIRLQNDSKNKDISNLVWHANIQILWHEQSRVVQPLFDKLSTVFSGTMSLIASFDYRANHKKSSWILSSRIIFFMISKGLKLLLKNGEFPDVTNLEHRWLWISLDLLKKWKTIEINDKYIIDEINYLSTLESRNLY